MTEPTTGRDPHAVIAAALKAKAVRIAPPLPTLAIHDIDGAATAVVAALGLHAWTPPTPAPATVDPTGLAMLREQRDRLLGDLNLARQEITRLTALAERKTPRGIAHLRDRLGSAAAGLERLPAAYSHADQIRLADAIEAITDAVRVLYTIEEGQR